MPVGQVPEYVDRDYIDNFSIKEMAREELVPKYFEGHDVSDLNVGLIGYTTELVADGMEDTFNTVSTLHEEMFPNRAKFPSSILSHAAIFQLSNGVARAASCDFILILNESYVIKNFQNVNGTLTFYIDKDTKILVEDIVFTLDYDIVIRGIKRETSHGYIYSAQYDIEDSKNSISSVTTPYININKSVDGRLTLKVTCHQCQRVVRYENIVNNTKINMPSFDVRFDKQLAGFDIFYKSATDTEYSVQLEKLPRFSTPIKTPFCFYSFTDENVLTIFFGNRDNYFQPDFNSEVEVVLYITDGAAGNFDVYNGRDITVVTTSTRFPYNDNFFLVAQVISASTMGNDTMDMEALQALAVEGYRTATIYSTDNDLMEYFNNYKYRFGNECLFLKKRDDVVDRLYSGFVIMKKDDYIYPTNTMYISTNLHQLTNSDVNKYIIDPGCLFAYSIYTGSGDATIMTDNQKIQQHLGEYYKYLEDNGKTRDEYTFWEYFAANGINPNYTIFDGEEVIEEAIRKNQLIGLGSFIYTNPFLISVTKNPNLVGLYLTIINQTSAVDFMDQNLEVFDQFIMTRLTVERKLEREKKYTISTALFPAATLSVDADIITEYGKSDKESLAKNTIRVVAAFQDEDGHNACFKELIPTEMTTDGTYAFEGTIFTDKHDCRFKTYLIAGKLSLDSNYQI